MSNESAEPSANDREIPGGLVDGVLGLLSGVGLVIASSVVLLSAAASGAESSVAWMHRPVSVGAETTEQIPGQLWSAALAALGSLVMIAESLRRTRDLLHPGRVVLPRRAAAAMRSLAVLAMSLGLWGVPQVGPGLAAVVAGVLGGLVLAVLMRPQRGSAAMARRRRGCGSVIMIAAAALWLSAGQTYLHHSSAPAGDLTGAVEILGLVLGLGILLTGIIGGLWTAAMWISESWWRYVSDLRRGLARQRARWIHDAVLSEVSHVIMKLLSRPEVDHEVLAEMRALDHRLRVAQVEELVAVGPVRIASLLQPHIRRAQDLGLTVTGVPAVDRVDVEVNAATGQLLSHVFSVLFSNAINAGAERIGVDLSVGSDEFEVSVSDDAGGFELSEVPAGRALHELVADLGTERVHREPLAGGSVMKVVVPRRLLLGGRPAPERSSADREWIPRIS